MRGIMGTARNDRNDRTVYLISLLFYYIRVSILPTEY